jgi:hypothetical protein
VIHRQSFSKQAGFFSVVDLSKSSRKKEALTLRNRLRKVFPVPNKIDL